MSNKPPVEHIELTPRPMDAWRAALGALIAIAPGDATAIAWHLADATRQLQGDSGTVEQLLHEARPTWRKPVVRLRIRDINALSPEQMRLIIQEVLRSQSLEQQNGLVEPDIGPSSQAPIGDADDLPASTLADRQARDGVQRPGQQVSSLGAVDQPQRGSLAVGQAVVIDEAVVKPGPVRPSGEFDIAPLQVHIPLHVDAGIADGQLNVHGSSSS